MFKVTIAGVHSYRVLVPDRSIYDEAGYSLDGQAIEASKLILISPTVAPEDREGVLGHEVEHCWSWYVPPAQTDEQRCQLTATIMQALRLDLEAQGGIDALKALQSSPVRLPYAAPPVRQSSNPAATMNVNDRWECGAGCGSSTMCGSIHTGPVELHEGLGQYQVARWFVCEACDALNVWREVATSDGCPVGTIVAVPRPVVLRGDESRRWLKEHDFSTLRV